MIDDKTLSTHAADILDSATKHGFSGIALAEVKAKLAALFAAEPAKAPEAASEPAPKAPVVKKAPAKKS